MLIYVAPLCFLLGPDRKFIAAGFDEVETAATGEIKQGANYGAPGAGYLALGRLDIGAVEHQECAALRALVAQIGAVEAAIQPFSLEGAIIGAIIGKLPAESGLKEGLGGREIPRRKLHIVQFFMGFHAVLLPACPSCVKKRLIKECLVNNTPSNHFPEIVALAKRKAI